MIIDYNYYDSAAVWFLFFFVLNSLMILEFHVF